LTKNLPTHTEEGDPDDFEVHASSTESFESRQNKGPLNVANEAAMARTRSGNVENHIRTGAVPKVTNRDALKKAFKKAKASASKARSSRRGIDPDQVIEEELTPLQTRVRGGVKGARSSGKVKPQADNQDTSAVEDDKAASKGAEKGSTRTVGDGADGTDDESTTPPEGKKPKVDAAEDDEAASKGAEKGVTRTVGDGAGGADDETTTPPEGKKPKVDENEERAAKGAKLVDRSSAHPAEKGLAVTSTKKGDAEVKKGGRRRGRVV
jgi:hypothetical protein